jgi:beta-lactamase superfamily II metal-dependent hydrolase
MDVGQGDSILIRGPEGLLGLIDGGETDSGIVQLSNACVVRVYRPLTW